MKILVIDDTPINLDAAKAQLADHDVTVAASYDKAMQLMFVIDEHHVHFGGIRNHFDVVLVDLLMPASRANQAPTSAEAGKTMDVGIYLALLAASRGVARFVGLLTDSGHHNHPASACLDAFQEGTGGRGWEPLYISVNDCRVVLTNKREWVNGYEPSDLANPLELSEVRRRGCWEDSDEVYGAHGLVRAKSWDRLLTYLATK